MYSRRFLVCAAVAVVFGFATGATPIWATAKTHAAKISLNQARTIALKAYLGRIMREELEHERGGSGLRYSFDMRRGKQWREIGVDAVTGRVLESSHERANPKD